MSEADLTKPQEPTVGRVQALEAAPEPVELSAAAIESSTPFVGRWNELVSTTNWEKGRIIVEWRAALVASSAAVTEYSDEAWARLVGGVTSQHVGRLRRAQERFASVREQYAGLYWSHFQAALDWEDAEMWLEGAIKNSWSVSKMRAARWDATGGPGEEPASEVIETQLDEDSYTALVERDSPAGDAPQASPPTKEDRPSRADDDSETPFDIAAESEPAAEPQPRVRPFAELPALPDDIAEAFETFKVAILSHKLTGWEAISCDDLLGVLESLKELAIAPSADD